MGELYTPDERLLILESYLYMQPPTAAAFFYIYHMKWFVFFLLLCSVTACNTSQDPATKDTVAIIDQPAFASRPPRPDSIEVIYYKKPFTDKERYTRFFSNLVTRDTGLIGTLMSVLALPGVREDSIRTCMSEGKINIPLKGDAYQVVYFSRETSPCNYLYIIRNGQFFYYTLDATIMEKLNQLEKLAKNP